MPAAGGSSWPMKAENSITGNVKAQNPQKDMTFSEK